MSDEILRAAGIVPALSGNRETLAPVPSSDPNSSDSGYPVATVGVLSTYASVSTLVIAYALYKFRHFIREYIGNHFSYALSDRRDLVHELTYTFRVGDESITTVTISTDHGEIELPQAATQPVVEEPADETILEEIHSE